jgi:hypothetical protein
MLLSHNFIYEKVCFMSVSLTPILFIMKFFEINIHFVHLWWLPWNHKWFHMRLLTIFPFMAQFHLHFIQFYPI